MGPEALAQVLRPLNSIFDPLKHPKIVVGLEDNDDAAVYKISHDTAIIHTLDFFTPIVDDPYTYGAIAAANSMSDVYAMGGEVIMALNICCFPDKLPPEIITEILRGGAEKVAEAGGAVAGGHTIDDKEPKYGLSVIGTVHPDRIFRKAGAKPGDILVLTKPLGTGIITTAAKSDAANPEHLEMAVKSMLALNAKAARIFSKAGVSSCTDITGFSFLGHASQMTSAGSVRFRLSLDKIPFIEGATKYAGDWLFPGGSSRNRKFFNPQVEFDKSIPEETRMLLFTPETSGGLLAAVNPQKHSDVIEWFKHENIQAWTVGEVIEGTAGIQITGNF
jgi:selenide,water dikinase